jgi:hypothetical protein
MHFLLLFVSEMLDNDCEPNQLLCCDSCPRCYCLSCLEISVVRDEYKTEMKGYIIRALFSSHTCLQAPPEQWICSPCQNIDRSELFYTGEKLAIILQVFASHGG